jgi:membrane protein DedA with SNARE-associated domain
MKAFIEVVEAWLVNFSEVVSIEVFVLVGGFIEEILAPIPSPLILGSAGSLAEVTGQGIWYLLWIAVVASIAKLLASLILYVVVDKFEDIFMGKFGKFFGITHEEIEGLGRRLGENPYLNFGVLFGLRALPVMSSAVVSVMAGFVKVDLKIYAMATFFGNIIRNMFFLVVGYYGLESAGGLMSGMSSVESILKFAVVVGIVLIFLYFKFRKKR